MDPDQQQLTRTRKLSDGTQLAVYEIRQIYGRPLAYPVNDRAETIQGLTGSKRCGHDIAKIESLGFNVVTIHGERLKPATIE